MLEWHEYGKFLVTLLVIVDPIGVVPLFVVLSNRYRELDRRQIANLASVSVAIILVVTALIGEHVLNFFGITIASFKVGGAILIMLMAIAMMQAQPMREKQTPQEAEEAALKPEIAVVPLAIPLLAGPGAISTTIIYATERASPAHYAVIVACCLAAAMVTWVALRLATSMSKVLGRTGINIAVRIMGLLLAAVAVEIFVSGLKTLLPALNG